MSNKRDPYIIMLRELVEELVQLSPSSTENSNSSSKEEDPQLGEHDSPDKRPDSEPREISRIDEVEEESQNEGQESSKKERRVSAIVKTWLFFANSIMSGEFLAYSDYSRELDSIVSAIRNAYSNYADGDPTNPTLYLHPVLAVIHDLCFELRTQCMLMRIQIKVEKEKERVLAISSPLPHQWSSTNGENKEINRLVDWLRQLTEGLIEMTMIDFTCHTNKEKIKSLHTLFDACEQTKKVTALRGEAEYTPFTEAPLHDDLPIRIPYGEDLLNTIRCKCSLLAYQSIFKIKQSEEEILFSSSEPTSLVWDESKHKDKEAPYKAVEKALLIINGDRLSVLELSSDTRSLFGFWKNQLYYCNYEVSPFNKEKHIIQYNEYIKESQKNRNIFSKAVTRIRELGHTLDIETLATIINQSQNERYRYPPFEFLLTCMRAIEGMEIKPDNDQDRHTRVKLLGDLLLLLHELKTRYEYINQPYEQIRFFEKSFFCCDPERPIPFFVASLGCKYINHAWLDKLDIHSNRLLRQYRIQESGAVLSSAQDTFEEVKTMRSTLKDQQRDYLTLLGIFAALITLSVSLVASFNLAKTIWDYMVMLGGAYVLIGLLVIVLYLTNRDDHKKPNYLRRGIMAASMIIAAVLGGYGVAVKSGFIDLKAEGGGSSKSEERTTSETRVNSSETSPTTIVNQMQLELPKNSHSTHPRRSKESKGLKKQDSIPPC